MDSSSQADSSVLFRLVNDSVGPEMMEIVRLLGAENMLMISSFQLGLMLALREPKIAQLLLSELPYDIRLAAEKSYSRTMEKYEKLAG